MFSEELVVSTVFVAGILSFFAPCTYALIPVYIGLMTDQSGDYRSYKIGFLTIKVGAVINTLAFVAGLSVAFIILGFGAGALGSVLYSPWITTIGGAFIVLLGLQQLELLKLPAFINIKAVRIKHKGVGVVKVFLTGLAFSLGWTPCVGPILGAVLLTSATSGQALYGGFLMMVYALGLALPFMILAIASGSLMAHFSKMEKYLGAIKKVGGVIIVLMGIALMTNQLITVSARLDQLF